MFLISLSASSILIYFGASNTIYMHISICHHRWVDLNIVAHMQYSNHSDPQKYVELGQGHHIIDEVDVKSGKRQCKCDAINLHNFVGVSFIYIYIIIVAAPRILFRVFLRKHKLYNLISFGL